MMKNQHAFTMPICGADAKTNTKHCAKLILNQQSGQKLTLLPRMYLFIPQDANMRDEYEKHISITEIFSENGDPAPGIVTTQDEFAISFTEEEMKAKVATLLKTETEAEARTKFRLCSQNQWNYDNAKRALAGNKWEKDVSRILYRPFDQRFTVYNPHVAVHRRDRVMKHLREGNNLALITARANKSLDMDHFFCSRYIVEKVW